MSIPAADLRFHILSGQRQLRDLGRPVPTFDEAEIQKLEALEKESELELEISVTKAELAAIKEHISAEFRKMFSNASSATQRDFRRAL
jgi:hypothetical protein